MDRGSDERRADYRKRYLKLKSVVWDRATGLPAYPVLLDDLRAMLDQRRHIGLVRIGAQGLAEVESLYGWQVLDQIRGRIAEELAEARGETIPEGALLGVDRIAGDALLVFVPQTDEGSETETSALEELGRALIRRLDRAFDDDELVGLNPRLVFDTGHALISIDPFRRFERRLHDAVEEARTRNEKRDRLREASWTERLQQVVEEGTLESVLQPVVDLESREVLGFEALARGPGNTPLEMPRALFRMADKVGIAVELDRACLDAALRASSVVAGHGKLFVNTLPRTVDSLETQALLTRLGELALGPEDLVLELSEREADADPEAFVETLSRLRGQGFAVALDDIGTGYASQAVLEHAHPDYLKLDVSLVHEIERNLIKQDLLASVVRIAGRIGAQVIGEGVETEAEAETLRRAGARYGQGHLFAAPAPPAATLRTGSREGREH